MKYCVIFKYMVENSENYLEAIMSFYWHFHPNLTDTIFFDDIGFKITEISFDAVDAENEGVINFIKCEGYCNYTDADPIYVLKLTWEELKLFYGEQITANDANPYSILEKIK